jgi:hypothetical protein
MILWRVGLATLVILEAVALGDGIDKRAKLGGTWEAQGADGNAAAARWVIEEKDDSIRIAHSEGSEQVAEFECNTMGRECKSGKHDKVSMWFSGAKLVQLETKGSEVVKRRFALTGQGDTLDIEVIPVVPAGNAQTLHLKRVQVAAQSH